MPQAAACLAYFVLLTVFPVLICVSYILGMVNIDIVSLMDQLQPLLPEAALDVLETLEQEYRVLYGRNLTLSRLSEAVILPLCPDKGTCLHYDPNLAASVYLRNDLEGLMRQYQGD